MVLTNLTSSKENASNVDERGTEVQTATRKRLQTSGASIARTILTTPKIAAKGTLTPRSPQHDFKNKNLKMTLVVIVLYLLLRIREVEVRSFLIYFLILALQAMLLMTNPSF